MARQWNLRIDFLQVVYYFHNLSVSFRFYAKFDVDSN